jgi:alpha-ribazole phosphatase
MSAVGWAAIERQTAGRTWSRVVASPSCRARDPAAKLAQARNLPLRIDADWAELDFGAWDGRAVDELRRDPMVAAHLDEFYAHADAPAAPDGETWQALLARVVRALDRLSDENKPHTLVVTHAGPMRAALSIACGLPFDSLWALRIDYATRITLRLERSDDHPLWGEIVEIVQA